MEKNTFIQVWNDMMLSKWCQISFFGPYYHGYSFFLSSLIIYTTCKKKKKTKHEETSKYFLKLEAASRFLSICFMRSQMRCILKTVPNIWGLLRFGIRLTIWMKCPDHPHGQ